MEKTDKATTDALQSKRARRSRWRRSLEEFHRKWRCAGGARATCRSSFHEKKTYFRISQRKEFLICVSEWCHFKLLLGTFCVLLDNSRVPHLRCIPDPSQPRHHAASPTPTSPTPSFARRSTSRIILAALGVVPCRRDAALHAVPLCARRHGRVTAMRISRPLAGDSGRARDLRAEPRMNAPASLSLNSLPAQASPEARAVNPRFRFRSPSGRPTAGRIERARPRASRAPRSCGSCSHFRARPSTCIRRHAPSSALCISLQRLSTRTHWLFVLVRCERCGPFCIFVCARVRHALAADRTRVCGWRFVGVKKGR
ncbi:hypothetical protein BJ912DRAFT_1046055 [Pholiota molesta]|nr:hypothetical protein BJ912DRAFT_1046055 [Pholiota molesta]